MKKMWIFLIAGFLLLGFTNTGERTVTGTVTSAEDQSPLPGVNVAIKGTSTGTVTDEHGKYALRIPENGATLVFSFIGLKTQEVVVGEKSVIDVQMESDAAELSEVVVTGYSQGRAAGITSRSVGPKRGSSKKAARSYSYSMAPVQEYNTESYAQINENIFHDVRKDPLSTFSIDVDAASYSNVRRFIDLGQRPPEDAVRIEEMINYFDYDYAQPEGEHPFAFHTEVSSAPWNEKHRLIHIGLQGKNIPMESLPPSNLVFLIDVSGSMDAPNKLPLVKKSFAMLVDQLREQDKVAIVVYAGAAGVVLEPTSGADKKAIHRAIARLEAGGSTAGGEGLRLAYALAKQHFRDGGNNRVVLATDGDFNVGESSDDAMEDLITEKRKDGIFLTVLGYGMGNYKDSKMEILADKGNGNYAYIDNITEARKVLVNEFGGTLFTIAKDVKLQIEFNPARVRAYRLIGYENRLLKNEDFNNDKKDAGELGSGHTVTALYEVIPVGVKSDAFDVDPLKYQRNDETPAPAYSDELMTVKFRYKDPDGERSKLIVHPVNERNVSLAESSDNFRWSASVAAFGMLLRSSPYARDYTYDEVAGLAQSARGNDREGYRIEFINMVKSFSLVAKK